MNQIRAATIQDLESVFSIDDIVFYSDEERKTSIRNWITNNELMVKLENNEVVGYYVMQLKFFNRNFIEMMMVKKSKRRCGIGEELIHHALQSSTTSRVFVSTNESNIPMQKLLEKDGWKYSGILTGLDDGDDEMFYYKDK